MSDMDSRINVTKAFLPPINEYQNYLESIWSSGLLTNQGPLLSEFESKIEDYLEVDNFQFVSNGTIALQLALRALNVDPGEVITTPFSYVATTSSILWEGFTPVFVDIKPDTFCIDPEKVEAAITEKTKAIMAVHVFGNPCDVEAIQAIADKHSLKVIYDGAHAFGVRYNGKSIFSYGDISTCSFHATKLFHTIEGGGVFTSSQVYDSRIDLAKRFGHNHDEHLAVGINGKANEFQAAMGLVNLTHINEILEKRKSLIERYNATLPASLPRPTVVKESSPNFAYYPLLLPSETVLHRVIAKFEKHNIFPRRYFYPSLNTLDYLVKTQACPISEDIASRIICLPLYFDLTSEQINVISEVLSDENLYI